jgi:hypothetical protein
VPRVRPSTVGNLAVSETPLGNPQAATAYIASLSTELAKLARWHRLDTLSYLIDMVRLEAEDTLRR